MLLPLVNLPMVEYTLEWLATAGVTEVSDAGTTGTIALLHT